MLCPLGGLQQDSAWHSGLHFPFPPLQVSLTGSFSAAQWIQILGGKHVTSATTGVKDSPCFSTVKLERSNISMTRASDGCISAVKGDC